MNIDNPSSPGGGQAPKKIEAYQCNLCPAVFGFKFNAKRHFQKLHPEDEYDGSKITNIKFKCYGCQWGFDTYGNLEAHFAQVHQGQILNPEKVYLGDTQTTAATFQSVKRMKTPSKRKKPAAAAATAESHTSRPSSAAAGTAVAQPPPATQQTSQFYGLQQQQHRHNGADQLPPAHVMMAPGHPDRSQSTTMSYQGDLLCNSCDFTSDNPQSLALHQQTHIQTHFNSNGMSPLAQPSQPPPPSQQQQHYYNAAHQHQHHDPFIDFKAEEQQYQQHMYQQQPYQPPYHHGYQQQGYHHYPQSHHQMYNNQMPQQYQNYHHYPPPHPPPPPHHTPSAVTNQAPSPSPQTPPHPQQIQYPAASVPPSHHHQQPPQYHEVPHYQSQQQQQPPPTQSMIANSSTTYSDQQPPQHLTEVKSEPNEALIDRQQNGNAVTVAAGGGSDSSSASPHHHQQGGRNSPYHGHQPHGAPPPQRLQEYSPTSRHQSSVSHSNGSEGSKVMSTVAKQRRTNIGKMFQTHICFVCDSKLAKLDCIKMHFKNKHPETALDLNQVLISRVVCYICGVRKKEYAILVRHFQVEHKDQEIDPYRIGMDEPSPFNLSPEEETDLNKLPIPQPVKHDLNSSSRKIISTTPAAKSNFSSICNLDITNDNTMDSIEDEQYQLPINVGVSSIEHGRNSGSRGVESELAASNENNHHQSSIPMSTQSPPRKKPRVMKRAFKNNKCRTCGKAFSRITTVKKHFLDHHPEEVFDRATKVEVIKLPCYLCDTMITDARHALRHFESAHPGQEFDASQVHISGVEFTNGANEEDDLEDSIDSGDAADHPHRSRIQLDQDDDQENDGFRCYLCNYWCSKIEDFQAHFAPETKAHENVSEVTIICPVCMHKCQTTEEMFDHVTKEHGGAASATCTEDDASISSSSLSLKEEVPPPSEAPPSQQTVNNATNCVETC